MTNNKLPKTGYMCLACGAVYARLDRLANLDDAKVCCDKDNDGKYGNAVRVRIIKD